MKGLNKHLRYCLLFLLMICTIDNIYCQKKGFQIKGEIVSCKDSKDKPNGYIYLYQDSTPIDSVWTYHQTLFGDLYWTNGKFKFKGLKNGSYQIRYETYFDTQDFPNFEINEADFKDIEICFDKLPERLYEEETFLDNIEINDTIFINVYIAAGGEFGGYNEGFWIIREQNGFVGRFYSLPDNYAMHRDTAKVIANYNEKLDEIQPISDTFQLSKIDLVRIKRFLIDINHYHDDWISNAPEHFLIYGGNEIMYRIKNNSHFQPYLDLRSAINNGL